MKINVLFNMLIQQAHLFYENVDAKYYRGCDLSDIVVCLKYKNWLLLLSLSSLINDVSKFLSTKIVDTSKHHHKELNVPLPLVEWNESAGREKVYNDAMG